MSINDQRDECQTCTPIEGENLNAEEVRSTIARRLGIHIAGLVTSSRHVEGSVEMMLDATQKYSTPLTKEGLFNWHAALFPTGHSGMHRIRGHAGIREKLQHKPSY